MFTSEPALQRLARARIKDGRLPCHPTGDVRGGQGTGALCGVCGRPIGPDEIEYEVQFIADRALTCRLHFHCYEVWLAECEDGRNAH
jgi:hypothetical protein